MGRRLPTRRSSPADCVPIHRTHVKDPMFNLDLFKNRNFAAGNIATFLSSQAQRRSHDHARCAATGHLASTSRL